MCAYRKTNFLKFALAVAAAVVFATCYIGALADRETNRHIAATVNMCIADLVVVVHRCLRHLLLSCKVS